MTAFHTWLFVLSGSYWRGLPQLAGYSARVYSSYQSELSHATPPCHVPDQTPAKEREIKTQQKMHNLLGWCARSSTLCIGE